MCNEKYYTGQDSPSQLADLQVYMELNRDHLEGRGSVWGVGMGNVNDPVYVIVCMV